MGYTRKDAVDFADAHWNIPADGTFWLSDEEVVIDQVRMRNALRKPWWAKAPAGDGWQPFFVDDAGGGEKAVFRRVVAGVMQEILINPWEGIADCAHFLSRCLTEGGLSVNELSVPKMVAKLQGKSNVKTSLRARAFRTAGKESSIPESSNRETWLAISTSIPKGTITAPGNMPTRRCM